MTLAENLARLRKAKHLSQLAAAEHLGISRQAISRWETGLSVPSTENLRRLAALYGVSLDELLRTGGPPQPPAQAPQSPTAAPLLSLEAEPAPEAAASDTSLTSSGLVPPSGEATDCRSKLPYHTGRTVLWTAVVLLLASILLFSAAVHTQKEPKETDYRFSDLSATPWDSSEATSFPLEWVSNSAQGGEAQEK